MTVQIRLTGALWAEIHADLDRPHSFAAERVTFLACRPAAMPTGQLLLAHAAYPVADEHYESSYEAGAMVAGAAFSKALGLAYRDPVSVFHVHRHEHRGHPRFSGYDLSESAKFVPDFWKVRPALPHGALVLSNDSAYGLIWRAPGEAPEPISRFTIVGTPTREIRYDREQVRPPEFPRAR